MKKLFIISFIMTVLFFSCSKKGFQKEIEYTYNNKTKTYKIVFPEYDHVNPVKFKLPIKNLSIKSDLDFKYKIVMDNEPVMLILTAVSEDDRESVYNVYYPPVGKTVSLAISANDFYPNLKTETSIKNIYVSVVSYGNSDTKYSLEISLLDKKSSDALRDKKVKNRKKIFDYASLILPNPGHQAQSNPPFLYWDQKIANATIYISKKPLFDEGDVKTYSAGNDNFLMLPERLTYGKWYVRISDANGNADTYGFLIGEESCDIDIVKPPVPTNQRPFIFVNNNKINELKQIYAYLINYPAPRTMLGRNMASFINYTEQKKYKRDINEIVYNKESRIADVMKFTDIQHDMILLCLSSLFEKNPTNSINEVKKYVSGVIGIDTAKMENYSETEADSILAIPIAVALDWLYPYFNTQEIINIKIALVKKGRVIYKYLTENAVKYYDKTNIRYAATLALISMSLYGENTEEDKVREWYRFCFNYLNAMVFTQIGKDGDMTYSLDDTYEILFSLIQYAGSLKNVSSFDMFENKAMKSIGDYLLVTGYRGGQILPVGNNIKTQYGLLRNTDFLETTVMDALAGIYGNPLYKMHAAYGVNESVGSAYLPYSIIWNSDNAPNIQTPQTRVANYRYSYFYKTGTVIYSANPFTNKDAYFMVYGKGKSKIPHIESHNDRGSFVFYNYGDMLIDEGGFFGETENEYYNFLRSPEAHAGISIGTNDILEHPLSKVYIENTEDSPLCTYVKTGIGKKYTYNVNIENYTRRFYYIKPDILVIKDDAKILPDIYGKVFDKNYTYTWRFPTRLRLEISAMDNSFVIYGNYSKAKLYFVGNENVSFSIENDDDLRSDFVKDKLNIGLIKTKEKKSSFSQWIIIASEKNEKPNSDLVVLETTDDVLRFEINGRQYSIESEKESFKAVQTVGKTHVVSD